MTDRTLGAVLRGHRERAGLTQQQLADKAGLSLRALRDLEQDRVSKPRSRSLAALATALGLAGSDLLGLESAPPRPAPASVAVLGPLEVRRGGRIRELPAALPRRLLVLLALHHDRGVSHTEIVQVLWGARPPSSVRNLVHTYVGGLRRLLEPSRSAGSYRILVRSGDGYRIDPGQCLIDVADFGELAERGLAARAAGTWERAESLLGQALSRWRGPAADDDAVLAGHPATVRLNDRRMRVALAYADTAAALGRHDEVLEALRPLATGDSLHEALHVRLMRALDAAGRPADALALYESVRRRLADELGVDPGVELRAAHLQVLTRSGSGTSRPVPPVAARMPVPAQLPADPPGFSGRQSEIARLDTLLSLATGPSAAMVTVALTGTAGVGKTTLAIHWAHHVARHFPDGQLYANLQGYGPHGVVRAPAQVVRGFLDALGVRRQDVPADTQTQFALYRSLLSGRRILVVLDNARDSEQVRALLPGSSQCQVLVTSRNRLAGLVATDGARPLALDLLPAAEARELLARRLGADRAADDPGAIDKIINGCARLPLALAIVAARAATDPGLTLATLADELDQSLAGLNPFDAGEDAAANMRAAFGCSYDALDPPAARLFRLLGQHPGPDIAVPAAASLAGSPAAQVRTQLAELARASLVMERVPGRYTFHDLLRTYATELADMLDPEPERQAALYRVLGHYLHTAHAADRLLNPSRHPIELAPAAPEAAPEQLVDHEQAMAWFAAEHPVLLAAVDRAATAGLAAYAWQLAWTLVDFFQRQSHWHEWVATQRTAQEVTRRLADQPGQAQSHRLLGLAHLRLGELDTARTHLQSALELFARLRDPVGQALSHRGLGRVYSLESRHGDALHHAGQALTLFQTVGDRHGQANVFNAIGWYHTRLGDHRQALAYCQQALDLQIELDDRFGEANTWDSLGYAHLQLGHHGEAASCYLRSVRLARDLGDRNGEADTLARLGDAHHAAGDRDAARAAWQDALAILDDLHHPDAGEVRRRLDDTSDPVAQPAPR